MVYHETTPLLLSEEDIDDTPARSGSRPRFSIPRLFRYRKWNFRRRLQIKWKYLVRAVFKNGRKIRSCKSKRPRFQYDPLSYALNFDDGFTQMVTQNLYLRNQMLYISIGEGFESLEVYRVDLDPKIKKSLKFVSGVFNPARCEMGQFLVGVMELN